MSSRRNAFVARSIHRPTAGGQVPADLLSALLVSVSLIALSPAIAHADDFVVDTATTATNGGNAVDGNDTLTITETGSISTTANGEYGVQATGGNNTIINSGSIQTEGIAAHGICNVSSNTSPITNSGSIQTEGNSADGICNVSSDNSPVTNSGSIHTTGETAYGIYNNGSDNSPVTNSGSIHTTDETAYGIFNNGSNNSPVTNSGSIHTEGNYAQGIYNIFSNQSPITNSGSIHTEGDYAQGIQNVSSSNSSVTNSGTISTQGYASYGINGFQTLYSSLTNSGTISTQGDASHGIYGDQTLYSSLTNSGSIHTAGTEAHGMYADYNQLTPITNSGSIRTDGLNAWGIYNYGGGDAPVTNSGTIDTYGRFGYGILNSLAFDAPVINSGSVHTRGVEAHAIWNEQNNSSVTNSGYVVSELGYSFYFTSPVDNALNLQAPSYIGGEIRSESGNITLNIETGPSHSVLWQLPASMTGGAPNVSGPVPWFYNSSTRQFATYDPTAFAGSVNALGDMTGMLSRLGQLGGGTPSGNSFGMDLAPGEAASTYAPSAGSGFWLTGFGAAFTHDGDATTLARDIGQWGIAAGWRGQTGTGMEWGFMGGWLNSAMDASSRWTKSYDIDGEGWFAGLNGRQQFGAFAIDFGVTGGRMAFDQSRFVNDNTALTGGATLGRSWADSSYDGWFVAPEIGISTQFTQASGLVVTPSARIRYAGQWLDGYTETGSAANATVGDRALGMVEASGEIELARSIGFGTLSLRFGALTRVSTGDDAVAVTMLGATNSIGFGDTDSSAAYGGVGLDIDLSANTKLGLDATGFLGGNATGGTGMVKLTANF